MAGTYAKNTKVTSSASRDEIERTLRRFGAGKFGFQTDFDLGVVVIVFERDGLRVKMVMPLPPREDFEVSPTGKARPDSAIDKDWEQAINQRWRSLANGVKAKLALVDDGISTVEQEFFPYIVLPSGRTVFEEAMPQVRWAYELNSAKPMELSSGGRDNDGI